MNRPSVKGPPAVPAAAGAQRGGTQHTPVLWMGRPSHEVSQNGLYDQNQSAEEREAGQMAVLSIRPAHSSVPLITELRGTPEAWQHSGNKTLLISKKFTGTPGAILLTLT